MKTHGLTTRVLACAAVAVTCVAYADPGMRDGDDSFRDFHSVRTRADVSGEQAQAYAQGWRSPRDGDSWSARGGDIGAYGSPGSRYSGRSREEVRAELLEPRRIAIDGLENDPVRK